LKKILAFSLGVALAWPTVSVADHHVAPSLTFDGGSCSIWGYTNLTFGTNTDFTTSQLRARIDCKYKGFTAIIEGDVAPLLQSEKYLEHHPANYITQAWIAYTWKEAIMDNGMFSDTMLKIGRFQSAAGQAMPPLYEMITVNKPYAVSIIPLYVTGVSGSTKITESISFTADISGGGGYPFNDPRSNFVSGGMEASQLLRWTPIREGKRDVLTLSLMNQTGTYVQRNGAYFKWSPTEDFDLYGGGFYGETHYPGAKKASSLGAYVLGDYRVLQFQAPVIHRPLDLRVHAMGDYLTGPTDYVAVTIGAQLVLPKDAGWGRQEDSSLTIDAFWERLQIRGGPVLSGPGVLGRARVFY
jgi:hypothetical protein